jgi:hypothetical protein
MSKIYKAPKRIIEKEILLRYRYTQEQQQFHDSVAMPRGFQATDLKTEHNFIELWMDFSYFPFEASEAATKKIKCWKGHHEQFARAMLQLMRLCEKRKGADGSSIDMFKSIFPSREVITGSFWHPANSSDHDWYYAWFSMIAHPEFAQYEVENLSSNVEYMKKKLLLAIALQDLNAVLISEERLIKNGEIEKKMKKIAKKIKKKI